MDEFEMKIKLEWKSCRYSSYYSDNGEEHEGVAYLELPFEKIPDTMEFVWDIEEDEQ